MLKELDEVGKSIRKIPASRAKSKVLTCSLLALLLLGVVNKYAIGVNKKDNAQLTLVAVGDILLHCPLIEQINADKKGYEGVLLEDVKTLILESDITFGNFEGVATSSILMNGKKLQGAGGYAENNSILCNGGLYTGYPQFNYHPSVLASLKRLGFDILQLSSNHSLDRYSQGLDETIEHFKRNGILHVGARRSDEKKNLHTILERTVQGKVIRTAWVSCTYGTNGIPDKYGQLTNCYNNESVIEEIIKLKNDRAIDTIIFAPHWGIEYNTCPNNQQQELARKAADAGADLIIGTHPHVLQPIEEYNAPDGRNILIAYSLGNFISGQKQEIQRLTIALQVKIGKKDNHSNGRLGVIEYSYTPLLMVNRKGASARIVNINKMKGAKKKRYLSVINATLSGSECANMAMAKQEQERPR